MAFRKTLGIALVAVLAAVVSAAPLQLSIPAGQAALKQPGQTTWRPAIGTVILTTGDSISLGEAPSATITAGNDITFLLKDSCIVGVVNLEGSITLALEKGQMFLKKTEGAESEPIAVLAQGCTFTPVGTAAAHKINKKGDPSVAVVKGKIQATSPSGASVNVDAGMFSSFDPAAGDFAPPQKLPPAALQSLESWSGVKYGAEEPQPEPEDVAQAEPAPATPPQPQPEVEEPQPGPETIEEATPAPAPPTQEPMAEEAPKAEEETPKEEPKKEKEPEERPAAKAAALGPAPAPRPAPEQEAEEEGAEAKEDEKGEEKAEGGEGGGRPDFTVSAVNTTVDGEQWTRIAFAVDVPIWKFGVCFDVELWLDSKGQFSDKGWRFTKDDWAESLARKIRYVRFNHENDPVFVKIMGIENVTFGYGFVVDRFTNMLNYPDEKLLGLQFYLNDISPIGITLQAMVGDFLDFQYDGGVFAGRLAVRPLKPTGAPIISRLAIGGLYAMDRDQFAEGRKWKSVLFDGLDSDGDGKPDRDKLRDIGAPDSTLDQGVAEGWIDTHYVNPELEHVDTTTNSYAILGFDIGLPIIQTKILGLDVYGQFGMSIDDDSNDPLDTVDATGGWGIGAPGVRLRVGPIVAQVEYRHISGYFEPGYFGPYYYLNRLTRYPQVLARETTLDSLNLDGVYGMLSANIANIVILSGTYQYLVGEESSDQRFEATAGVGKTLIEKIPKINTVEVFYYQSDIVGNIFKDTPNKYWGYRLGAEIVGGAGVLWETRYGWEEDQNGKLRQVNSVTIGASISF